jgi:yecA family protein
MNPTTELSHDDIHNLDKHLGKFKTTKSFDLVGLDGFLHGIVSLSKPANPGEWIQMALTEKSISGNSKQAKEIIGLVFQYYNNIAENVVEELRPTPRCDGSVEQCKTWLKGFAKSFTYDQNGLEQLIESNDERENNLGMMVFSHALDFEDLQAANLSTQDVQDFQEAYSHSITQFEQNTPEHNIEVLAAITSLIRKILKPKNTKRSSLTSKSTLEIDSFGFSSGNTFRRDTPKVGRNEPCPCGSGKKYKHCHGKDAMV